MDSSETITLSRTASRAGDLSLNLEVTIPRKIGSVNLIREIGRGGMGVVWLGRDGMLNRDVAVKFLLGAARSTDDPHFTQFLEGARAAAAVRHPGLNAVYQADLVSGLPYLVMEFVDGPTLSDVLKHRGALSANLAVAIMLRVAEAVAELHERGIVHRDIKPGNVMLNAAGEVFVTDFGLACERIPHGQSVRVEGLAGTPAYMAPEMFDRTVSPRSDVYALGAMLFELLTGHHPFRGLFDEVRHLHATEPPPVQELHDRKIPVPIIELIERAMNKNQMYRLKSARQFMLTLNAAAKEAGVRIGGDVEIAALAGRVEGDEQSSVGSSTADQSSTYHEQLSIMAKERRNKHSASESAGVYAHGDTAVKGPRTLVAHVPCIQCEYDLHGVSGDAKCPECGNPVAESLIPNRLIFLPKTSLRAMRLGFTLFLVTAIIGGSQSLFYWLRYIARNVQPSTLDVVLFPLAHWAEIVWYMTAAAMGGASVWLLTTGALKRRDRLSVLFSRTGLVFGIVFVGTADIGSYWIDFGAITFVSMIGIGSALIMLGFAGATLHLSSVAARIPNRSLAQRAKALFVLPILMLPVFAVQGSAVPAFLALPFNILRVLLPVIWAALFWMFARRFRASIKTLMPVCVPFDSTFGTPTGVSIQHRLPLDPNDVDHQVDAVVVRNDCGQCECPHCGYDQRGVVAQWKDACPLQGVCGDCGAAFWWVECVRPGWSVPLWGVESETRGIIAFVRAAIQTAWWSLFPWKFWRKMSMAHAVRPKRLSRYAMFLIAAFVAWYLVWQSTVGAYDYMKAWRFRSNDLAFLETAEARAATKPDHFDDYHDSTFNRDYVMQHPMAKQSESYKKDWNNYSRKLRAESLRVQHPPDFGEKVIAAIIHPLGSYGVTGTWRGFIKPKFDFFVRLTLAGFIVCLLMPYAFMKFPASRCKSVRAEHVLRVAIYSTTLLPLCIAIGWMWFGVNNISTLFLSPATGDVPIGVSLIALVYAFIWQAALRNYLRIPHSWVIALSTATVVGGVAYVGSALLQFLLTGAAPTI